MPEKISKPDLVLPVCVCVCVCVEWGESQNRKRRDKTGPVILVYDTFLI